MAQVPDVPEAVKKRIGVESPPVTHVIERGAIRRFAEALGDANPRWQKTAPPTFFCSLRTEGTPTPGQERDIPYTRVLNGGNDWEYFLPVRPGDVLSVTNKLVDASMRPGRLGPMLFRVFEATYKNKKGQIVAKARNTAIAY